MPIRTKMMWVLLLFFFQTCLYMHASHKCCSFDQYNTIKSECVSNALPHVHFMFNFRFYNQDKRFLYTHKVLSLYTNNLIHIISYDKSNLPNCDWCGWYFKLNDIDRIKNWIAVNENWIVENDKNNENKNEQYKVRSHKYKNNDAPLVHRTH